MAENSLVFNVVWTGDVFPYLRFFVESLLAKSEARFRYIANGCTPSSIKAMQSVQSKSPERIVEVVDVSPDAMVAHGVALDAVYPYDDGSEFFAFVDTDIWARAPFVSDLFDDLLSGGPVDAVTSGQEVWTESNVVPDNHPGVGGRHFYRSDGYVYGSPHLAVYRRRALDRTFADWGVGFGAASQASIPEHAWDALVAEGHDYLVYDTAKIVNILLQTSGFKLEHREHDDLLHIGGLSHFVSPPEHLGREALSGEPSWTKFEGMEYRAGVARYTAETLRALMAGQEAPAVPAEIAPTLSARMTVVRDAMIQMVRESENGSAG